MKINLVVPHQRFIFTSILFEYQIGFWLLHMVIESSKYPQNGVREQRRRDCRQGRAAQDYIHIQTTHKDCIHIQTTK